MCIPLTADQIADANALWGTLEACVDCAARVEALNGDLAGPEASVILAKACAINVLFNAHVQSAHLIPLADYIATTVMPGAPWPDPLEPVKKIIDAPVTSEYKSFASKFVHFFVEPYGSVPIMDQWSQRGLRCHLGLSPKGSYASYDAFHADALTLRGLVIPTPPSFRDLDRYLWLAGQYSAMTAAMTAGTPLPGLDPSVLALLGTLTTATAPFPIV